MKAILGLHPSGEPMAREPLVHPWTRFLGASAVLFSFFGLQKADNAQNDKENRVGEGGQMGEIKVKKPGSGCECQVVGVGGECIGRC